MKYKGGKPTRYPRAGRLFRKYFSLFVCLLLICMTILGGLTLLMISSYWSDARKQDLLTTANTIASLTEKYIGSDRLSKDDVPAAENARLSLSSALLSSSQSPGSDVYICTLEGKVLLCKELLATDTVISDVSECEQHSVFAFPRHFISKLLSEKSLTMRDTLEGVYEAPHFISATCIYYFGEPIGFVVAAQSVSQGLREYLIAFLRIILLSMSIAFVIAFVTIYILVYNIITPMTDLVYATREYSKGDFSYRVPAKSSDELAELCEAFNSMASSLAALETSRRSFVANVSHELKTPMTSIGGFIDGMRDGTIPPEKHQYYLKIVSDEVKRLTRLITSMLNMSKIEAGELKLKKSEFNITDMIITTLLSFEKPISEKNIDISGLDEMSTLKVNADPDMINQVLYNLIDNAVKFTPNGGEINVKSRQIGNDISVCIRNYGIGISEADCRMIFERFYKVDKSRSFDVKSVGLGLYIVKNIVELHGGKINVASKLGEYTEFTFRLPR